MLLKGHFDAVNTVMNAETSKQKFVFAMQATLWLIFFGVCGGIYLAWLHNAN